jgi:DNA-directed RNA polymerase subunit K/omega
MEPFLVDKPRGWQSNRLLVAVLVFQRAAQLRKGARPRVDTDSRKSNRLALLEVMSGMVAWSVVSDVVPDHNASCSTSSADGTDVTWRELSR